MQAAGMRHHPVTFVVAQIETEAVGQELRPESSQAVLGSWILIGVMAAPGSRACAALKTRGLSLSCGFLPALNPFPSSMKAIIQRRILGI